MSARAPGADEEILRSAAGAVLRARDVVRIAGPDSSSFLQGQLSQDLDLVAATGASVWSLLLAPQGKVEALLRVTRVGPEELVLDTDAGWGDRVLDRLNRFKLRVRADLEALEWGAVSWRGPGVGEALGTLGQHSDVAGWIVPAWPTEEGVDLIGPDPARLTLGLVPWCDPSAYEVLRIEAGLPAMGRELTEATIPAEAGVVEHAVSFTKGCYTGQELVARIDSRGGNVPRRLWGLLLDRLDGAPDVPSPGATLTFEDREVGAVTSAAHSATRGTVVALGLVRRGVGPPAEVVVAVGAGGSGARSGRLVELPFAPPRG